MKDIRVLLVDLKSDLYSPPYQLGLIAAYALREPEVAKSVKFIFSSHSHKQPAEEVAKAIATADSDLVAISSYCWNYRKICRVFDLLCQSTAPLPRIVLGGPNCAGKFGADMMQHFPIVSAVVEGEGEPAFRDICAALADSPAKDPFSQARNCRIRDQNGEVVGANMGHRILYLDEVPSPYLTGLLPVGPAPIFYETNRGCPYRCAFCYWGNGNSKIYKMSHERVIEEMTFFAQKRVSSFILADANFGIFDSDVETAGLLAELNSRYDYPFKYLGVNYAKNSGDRVLDIASILRKGKIQTSTTLALQSVTPEAEIQSKRYCLDTSKFVHLVRSAHERGIPTYTDLILGMPGENIEEFLSGLEAAISTGVPAIKIHQLSLLPGTEFYDAQQKFGFVLMARGGDTLLPAEQRSEYWDFLVYSHPQMDHRDLRRGLRMIGINHLLHNHNLGKVVNFYLARYRITPSQVYDFFDELLLRKVEGFPEEGFLARIRELILKFADSGLDSYAFETDLGMQVWFGGKGTRSSPNEPEVASFMHNFYLALCRRHNICKTEAELAMLAEFVDYNILISPKPRWRPQPEYHFYHDVDAIWNDMLEQIHDESTGEADHKDHWQDLSRKVSARLFMLLSDSYLESKRDPVTYTVVNPLPFMPGKLMVAWAVTNRDWFCRVNRIQRLTA